jgi:exopolyphosphatase/pppGpp-phosphohydrolase
MTWHALAVKWWDDLWHSPMAPRFLNTDMNELLRAAILVHDFWRAVTPDDRAKLDAAIIRQTSRFGLSNWDRNRMNWTITGKFDDKPVPQSQPPSPTFDPRKVLRAV